MKMSLPHERRKAMLKSKQLQHKVKLAETKENLSRINAELAAMRPKRKTNPEGI